MLFFVGFCVGLVLGVALALGIVLLLAKWGRETRLAQEREREGEQTQGPERSSQGMWSNWPRNAEWH